MLYQLSYTPRARTKHNAPEGEPLGAHRLRQTGAYAPAATGFQAETGVTGSLVVMGGDRPRLLILADDLAEKQFVDAAVVHVDDLDLEPAQLQHLALVGNA